MCARITQQQKKKLRLENNDVRGTEWCGQLEAAASS